jgi:hypothetical protein
MFKETVMHAIHLKGVHVAKGPNLFAFSVGEVVWTCLALFFFLVSWAVGGDGFKDSLGGDYTLVILLLGVLIGAVLAALTRPKS